ncbi:MAG: FG-GAP repeat domain-containing protein, partial [Planctomycetaceae bacterium]
DGDLDLAGCDTRNFKLYWFENDGVGTFAEHLVEDGDRLDIFGDITGAALANSTVGDETYNRWFKTPRLERLMIGDVDADGHNDVVIVENLYGDVYWYKNSGTPANDPVWQRYSITSKTIPGAYDVALADFDGDHDMDVAVSTWRLSNKFVWFENPGEHESAESWQLHLIEENIAEPRTVRIADFNGDGRPDLLGTAFTANVVMWYENPVDARTNTWTRHDIDNQSIGPGHGMPADLDAAGDLDVVMALGMNSHAQETGTRESAWYENAGEPGHANEWKKRVLADNVDDAFEAIAVDINADGHLDVAATSYTSPHGGAFWLQNPGDARGAWARHELKSDWPRANQIISADLDGDGCADLVAGTTGNPGEIRWWRNEHGNQSKK